MVAPIDPAKAQKTGGKAGEEDEIIVEGRKNIWICELGRSDDDGPFSDFIEKICGAGILFNGRSVQYESPSQGRLEFGWWGSLKQDGQVIALKNYPRYDNPYCQAEFWAEKIHIRHNGKGLELDFVTGERTVIGGEI
jgi:hypothetical protein